jgi:hypothetical protein
MCVCVRARAQYEQTPISWAAEKGHAGVVTVLLEHNASVDKADIVSWNWVLWRSVGCACACVPVSMCVFVCGACRHTCTYKLH